MESDWWQRSATSECDRNQLFFDDAHMFDEYRNSLESVASLECDGSSAALLERRAQPAFAPVDPPEATVEQVEEMQVESGRVPVQQPPSGTVVYRLFHYLGDEIAQRVQVPCDQVLQLMRARCPLLVPDTERRRTQIEAAMRAYVRRWVLGMLCVDEKGGRLRTILAQLQELYLWWGGREVRGAKNNWAHVELLHTLLERTLRESLDCANDQFYRKCADVRKRGRRPTAESANPPHPLNQLKADYILSAKAAPPVVYEPRDGQFYLAYASQQPLAPQQLAVDYYPLFVKLLGIVNECVPRHTNHGWFTERVRLAARRLSARDWPAHGLCQSLLNLQAVLERRRVRIVLRPDQPRRPRCCYTGLPLQDGEEVWLLRLLVLSEERHRRWVREGAQPVRKADDPLLVQSIRCYYLKTRVTSLCSLFYSEFEPAYKQRYPEYFAPELATTTQKKAVVRLLPPNRRFLFSPLWALLNRQQRFVQENELQAALWDRRESYAHFCARLQPLLGGLGQEPDEKHLLFIIFVALFGVHEMEQLSEPVRRDASKIREFTQLLLEATLSFADALFDTLTQPQHGPETVGRASYAMPLLGIESPEQAPADAPRLLVVRPQLQAHHQPLLRTLLVLSERRRARPTGYMAGRQQQQLMELCLVNHPFYFMLLYETLFQSSEQLDALSFGDARALRARLGLTLNESYATQ